MANEIVWTALADSRNWYQRWTTWNTLGRSLVGAPTHDDSEQETTDAYLQTRLLAIVEASQAQPSGLPAATPKDPGVKPTDNNDICTRCKAKAERDSLADVVKGLPVAGEPIEAMTGLLSPRWKKDKVAYVTIFVTTQESGLFLSPEQWRRIPQPQGADAPGKGEK